MGGALQGAAQSRQQDNAMNGLFHFFGSDTASVVFQGGRPPL
jgi:hypothetical protein